MQNINSGNGTAALGTVETTTGGTITKGGSIVAYNAGNPFEFDTTTVVPSGASIQFIWVGFIGGSSYSTATALGVSADSTVTVGTTFSDPNGADQESASPFGVGWVTPEPATLALTGLGGLSMLCLRRRQA